MIIHALETFNTDKAVLYANCKKRLSKISSKYNRDITEKGYQNC